MNIALNLCALRGYGSGLVGRAVLRELLALDHGHVYDAWLPRQWASEMPASSRLRHAFVAGEGWLHKLYTENVSLRASLCRDGHERLFSMGDTSLPQSCVPHLLLVQTPYLAYSWADFDFPTSPLFRARLRAMDAYFRTGVRWVDRFTVQSHHMKRRMVSRWDIDPERIEIVPSAVEPAASIAQVHPARPGYLCYVATATPHKNHVVLAGMMKALADNGMDLRCKLTVTAAEVPALVAAAERAGVASLFDFLGNISYARAQQLMSSAEAVVLPAKLESFGLPYYEAMSLGVPIVASARDCAMEACGDAAAYADADDGAAFAAAVERVLSDRDGWSARARRRHAATAVSWAWVAGRYLGILERL